MTGFLMVWTLECETFIMFMSKVLTPTLFNSYVTINEESRLISYRIGCVISAVSSTHATTNPYLHSSDAGLLRQQTVPLAVSRTASIISTGMYRVSVEPIRFQNTAQISARPAEWGATRRTRTGHGRGADRVSSGRWIGPIPNSRQSVSHRRCGAISAFFCCYCCFCVVFHFAASTDCLFFWVDSFAIVAAARGAAFPIFFAGFDIAVFVGSRRVWNNTQCFFGQMLRPGYFYLAGKVCFMFLTFKPRTNFDNFSHTSFLKTT